MIIISDCNKDIVIPAGLGDNPGVAGVKSLNGETGDLKIKTVNGNDMLGEGNVAIDAGVKSLNGETGDLKIKTVNGNDMLGEGNVAIDAGVKSLNGETGDLKIKTVNGNDMLGEGNVAIDTGVETLNGQKGALTLKTVNGNELTGDGNIEIQAGSDYAIVLDGLTQEERKAVYDKFDKTIAPNAVFIWENSQSFNTFWNGEYVAFDTFKVEDKGLMIHKWFLKPDGNISVEIEPYMHVNSLFLNLRDHVDENADFKCDYYGDYQQYMTTDNTYPNSYYIKLPNGIGDTNKYIFTPVTVVKDGPYVREGIRIQFTANEKLYTYLHGDADGKWLFESAKPIGGVQSSEVSNIKVLTQAEYDALTTKDENVLYCIKG